MERTSSAGGPMKRPLYVLIAVIIAWLFGVGGCTQGTEIIGSYWSPMPDVTDIASRASTEADREALKAAATRCFEATERGKGRLFPLGVASFVLGATMVVVAARAMAGRNQARAFLIQLLLAQAAFVVVSDLATRSLRNECLDFERGVLRVALVDRKSDPSVVDQITPDLRNKLTFAGTVLRCAAAGLVVLALTRRRTREYFESVERLRRDTSEGS